LRSVPYPFGEGKAQDIVMGLYANVEAAYEEVERLEATGEVVVIRDGKRGHERLEALTLRDLPAVLETLVILEAEHEERKRARSVAFCSERKERERVRAKERRKLKKLGEW